MKRKEVILLIILFVSIVFGVQHLFIVYVPNIIFGIGKFRSGEPLNTVIYAPKTDAKLRKVVLPNPDFIYNACFYDATARDILITGEFPDSTQYASLAFYGNNVQPYYVMNNQRGLKQRFKLRLSSVNRVRGDISTPTKQGAVLLRMLVTDSFQMEKALSIQKTFKVQELDQSE